MGGYEQAGFEYIPMHKYEDFEKDLSKEELETF